LDRKVVLLCIKLEACSQDRYGKIKICSLSMHSLLSFYDGDSQTQAPATLKPTNAPAHTSWTSPKSRVRLSLRGKLPPQPLFQLPLRRLEV
jgi:hypothetical protein